MLNSPLNRHSPSQIIYASVASNRKIQCEHSIPSNLTEIVQDILSKDLYENSRSTYNYNNQYHAHILSQQHYKFIAITDSIYPRSMAYEFLQDLKISYLKNANLTKKNLGDKIKAYNMNQSENKIVLIRNQIQEINNLMVMNIERVLERGTKINILIERTQDMDANARIFYKDAKKVKNIFCCRRYKWTLIICILVLAVIVALGVILYIYLF